MPLVVVSISDRFRDLPPSQVEAVLHGSEEPAYSFAAGGDLDMGALTGNAVYDGEGVAPFIIEVLGDVQPTLVTARAERPPSGEGVMWSSTALTVGGMAGKGFHDEDLVVLG